MPGRTGAKPKFAKPISELAKLVGLSSETLRKNLADGAPTPKNARDVQPWAVRFHQWRKDNVGTFQQQQQAAASSGKDALKAKHDRELAQWRAAEAKLRVGEKTKSLVSRRDVIELASKSVLTVRSRLNAMVMKMQSRLENVPGHVVVEELQDEVDAICNAFAGGMSKTFGGIDEDAACPFCDLREDD